MLYGRIPEGGHIGFEDKVGLDVTLPGVLGLFQQAFFTIINLLIYQVLSSYLIIKLCSDIP